MKTRRWPTSSARNTTVTNLQDNVFFLRGEVVAGQVFLDAERQRPAGPPASRPVAASSLELLNDEGEVVATTMTNSRGQVPVQHVSPRRATTRCGSLLPNHFVATTPALCNVLVSRGDLAIGGIDFGLRLLGRQNSTSPRDQQLAAVDTAFATDPMADPLNGMLDSPGPRKARPAARPR